MTREEAIKYLSNKISFCKSIGDDWTDIVKIEALELAVRALEQQESLKVQADAVPMVRKPKNNPITDADKIRQMSDEELAEFLAKQEYKKPTFDGWLPLCNHVMGGQNMS